MKNAILVILILAALSVSTGCPVVRSNVHGNSTILVSSGSEPTINSNKGWSCTTNTDCTTSAPVNNRIFYCDQCPDKPGNPDQEFTPTPTGNSWRIDLSPHSVTLSFTNNGRTLHAIANGLGDSWKKTGNDITLVTTADARKDHLRKMVVTESDANEQSFCAQVPDPKKPCSAAIRLGIP
jgi:hypothetical protein